MLNAVHRASRSVAMLALMFLLASAAQAGPPLICHTFETDPKAPMLPWGKGSGWNSPQRAYDVERLTADTLRLLSPDAPIRTRMENLRRATIYAAKDPLVASELLTAVLNRALTAAADGSRDPLPWFDAGYLIESYRQASHVYQWDMLSTPERAQWALQEAPAGLDGYRYVRKALELAGANADIEYAASLMREGPVLMSSDPGASRL